MIKKFFLMLIMILFLILPIPIEAKEQINMGEFKITFYCPCSECSEGYGRETSSGKTAHSKHTIAVDPDVIDIGSKVLIGENVYVAEDTGGRVNGDHIDIFVDCHSETIEKGIKYKKVVVIR